MQILSIYSNSNLFNISYSLVDGLFFARTIMKFRDFYLSNVQFRLNLSIVRSTLGSAKLPKLNEDNKYTPTDKARLHPLSLHSRPRCYPKSWILEGLDSIFQDFKAFPAYPNAWIAFSSLSELKGYPEKNWISFPSLSRLARIRFSSLSRIFQAIQMPMFHFPAFPGFSRLSKRLNFIFQPFQATQDSIF